MAFFVLRICLKWQYGVPVCSAWWNRGLGGTPFYPFKTQPAQSSATAGKFTTLLNIYLQFKSGQVCCSPYSSWNAVVKGTWPHGWKPLVSRQTAFMSNLHLHFGQLNKPSSFGFLSPNEFTIALLALQFQPSPQLSLMDGGWTLRSR